MLKGHDAPGRRRKRLYFGKQAFIATTQGDKRHAEGVEASEAGVSGEFRVEDQLAGYCAIVMLFPEFNETETSSDSSPLRRSALE